MILPIHQRVRARMAETVQGLYQIPADDPAFAAIPVETPPRRAFGDLSVPLAFELARRLRKAPRAIAQEVVAALGPIEGISRVEAAPNGYVNFFLDRPAHVIAWLRAPAKPANQGLAFVWGEEEGKETFRSAPPEKEIVEHTAINPNKAAHIGHLRNAALGDAFGRLLRYLGRRVEIQNYIDDTGVQVADVAVGFRELEERDLNSVKALAGTTRFDYYCWDLYAQVTEWYEQDKNRLRVRAAALHDIERGDNPTAEMAAFIADRIVRSHLATMRRLNIGYDLLTWEGDILRLQFWAHAFEFLKRTGAVFLQTEGRLKGCWVMRIEEDTKEQRLRPERPFDKAQGRPEPAEGRGAKPPSESERGCPPPLVEDIEGDQLRRGLAAARLNGARAQAEGPASADKSGQEDDRADPDADEPREKVIVRSDGTVTYVGKDMAYQLWKFGLLGRDFHYRVFERHGDGRALWSTTSDPARAEAAPPDFGKAAWVCNVIDTRQSYLQKLVKQALDALGYHAQAAHSVHYAYEMVALSHETARELGYDPAEGADRPFVEVSGRKGLGVKADDLIDRLTTKASAEVGKRNPELSPDETRQIAEAIAIAAVRYFMVKFSRGKVIVFDIDEALNFEGESGPYLQYAVVRANNIFNKLKERVGLDETAAVGALMSTPPDSLTAGGDEADELWGLVLEAARLDEVVDQAVRTLELSVLAKYAFGLAQSFNAFYHRCPILNEERKDVQIWRAAAVAFYRAQLTRALDLMGCAVPARM